MVRKHVFVDFSDRVAAIRIDPVRRTTQNRNAPDSTNEESFFISAIERWNELNLASHYTNFARSCKPFVKSLPMILHNEIRIFELLNESILSSDEHSMEPLMDLLVQFARDLAEDFEQFYPTTLRACIDIITTRQRDDKALDVVEYAFNALAHLFKYLSRLLTSNLVPTYDILLPLFGGVKGNKQRPFVLRFAAESLGFLIRRCGDESLKTIIDHIVGGVASDSLNQQFVHSSAQLLASSLKGPQITLHSKAPKLISVYYSSCHEYGMIDLFCHTIVETLHHCRVETARPLYVAILGCITSSKDSFAARCLFVISGLRKGDRVDDWGIMFDSLFMLAPYCGLELNWSQAAGSILAYADILTSIKRLRDVLESMKDLATVCQCMMIVKSANPNAFTTFKSEFWAAALSKCHQSSTGDLKLLALMSLDLGIPEDTNVSNSSSEVDSSDQVTLKNHPTTLESIFEIWWRTLAQPITPKFTNHALDILLSISHIQITDHRAFQSVVLAEVIERSGLSYLLTRERLIILSRLPPHPKLLDAIRQQLKSNEQLKAQTLENFSSHIISSMNTCDNRVRASALELLQKLIGLDDDPQSLLDQCLVINSLAQNLETSRNICQRLRNLASKLKLAVTEKAGAMIISQVTLSFFFGMLTTRLQPVSNEVLLLIPQICENFPKEVCALAMKFVENPQSLFQGELDFHSDQMDSERHLNHHHYEKLDCHSLATLHENSQEIWSNVISVTSTLHERAREAVKLKHFDDLRALGIKALCTVPQIAESLAAVPLASFLLQAEEEDNDLAVLRQAQPHDEGGGKVIYTVPFTFDDKLLLLELFSKFRNVDKLQNSSIVYEKFLRFLASRHAPLQRIGLRCVLNIKTPEAKILRKYSSNLDALLDDKRFRDELLGFVSPNENAMDESSLHPEDENIVMPIVIRILYGRAQNSTKRNMRSAAFSSLHLLAPSYLKVFIDLAHLHLNNSDLIGEHANFSDKSTSRKVQGYLTLIYDFVGHLKMKSEPCVPTIMKNGILPILRRLSSHEDRNLRQLISKDLEELFISVPNQALWNLFYPEIYDLLIQPQLRDFASRNHGNASTLLRFFVTVSKEPELCHFINSETSSAVTSCLSDPRLKELVIEMVLKIVVNLAKNNPSSPATKIAITSTLQHLPLHMDRELPVECFITAIEAVNQIFTIGVGSFNESIIHNLAITCFSALQKPSRLIPLPVKGSLLFALAKILDNESCIIELIKLAYEKLAPLFRQFVSNEHRLHLSMCYEVFGRRLEEFQRVGKLIIDLNSFDKERLGEPDFARRSLAFEEVNEKVWMDLSQSEWLPLMFTNLFFMRDPEELALRNNGKYSIMRLIESQNAPDLVANFVLPAIKRGLRDSEDKFNRLYIDLLRQCAQSDILPSLNILLYQGNEEADFFINITHVQVHRRRHALQRLSKHAHALDGTVIAHYILSIVENFASLSGSKSGDLNNLADDALSCMTVLLRHVSAGQFKSIARRCVQNLVQNPEPTKLRKNCRIVTSVAQATPDGLDDFVVKALISPLHRFLSAKSNEHENLPDRVPLVVAMAYFMKPLNATFKEAQLPGKLTPLCHLLRSKIPELRDTVRQSLGRVAQILGPKYLYFIVTELYGALRRGGLQSHVLGFTVHSILVELNRSGNTQSLQVGDLDDSAGVIFRIVMNDTFGSIGDEKDSENYATTAKEVKQHKSYDTAEILATWTSLAQFGRIIEPIRDYLCSTKLSSKNEHKVEDVLRRLSAGLHKNSQASSQDSVVMAYEVFTLSTTAPVDEPKDSQTITKSVTNESLLAREQARRDSQRFFTVRLSSRDWYDTSDSMNANDIDKAKRTRYATTNLHLLQAFALETLRSVMTSTSGGATKESGKGLLTVSNVKGLIPVILTALESSYEDVNIAALRFATTALRLPVPFAESDNTLELFGTRILELVESSPNTNSVVCQAALNFLTVLIKSKPEFEINSGSLAYILERLKPDLVEPERQSTAISLVRAIFARQIMLPQIYDIADSLSKALVTNQSQHIRANCRAGYLQFLTTYPLGQSRLDRHLSSLAANLQYAAPAGRLSVMEMIQSLLSKINVAQLEPAFVQFYSALTFITVADTESECRQRARSLLMDLTKHVQSREVLQEMIKYCFQWLENLGKNNLLVRGGLEVGAMLKDRTEAGSLVKKLNSVVFEILKAGQRSSQTEVDWQLVYIALDCDVFDKLTLIEGVLLFPHPWVRAKAARIFGGYFKATDPAGIDTKLLIGVGQKLMRQIGAPRLNNLDGLQIVKNLVFIMPIWEGRGATMSILRRKESKQENSQVESQELTCVDWAVKKLISTVRTNISAEDHIGGKTAAVQVIAALCSTMSKKLIEQIANDVIVSLFLLKDQLSRENAYPELQELALGALSIYETTLGTTEYLKCYSKAQMFVRDRRSERKAKRSIEAVANPEIYAQKKLKRSAHKHEVRKIRKQKAKA